MKKKAFTSVLITAFVFSLMSCKGTIEKMDTAGKPDLVGIWRIDSMYNTAKDSSKNDMAFLIFTMSGDSNSIQFKADSTWKYLLDSSAQWENYSIKGGFLSMAEDTLKIDFSNDSSMLLTSKDSLVMVLKKQ